MCIIDGFKALKMHLLLLLKALLCYRLGTGAPANLIVDDGKQSDDEDENFLVEEAAPPPPVPETVSYCFWMFV